MKDRHGICDGCDRLKTVTLVHGRGLCVNCEILWGEAQKAMAEEVIAFIEIEANNYYKATMFDHSSAASCIAEELKQKYGGSDE